MNIILPKYENPPPWIPANLVIRSIQQNKTIMKTIDFICVFNNNDLKRKGNPDYDNRLTQFMPRLIYIKKAYPDESVRIKIHLILNKKK